MPGTINTRYVPLNVTTPAGTPIAAPVVTPVNLAAQILLEVHVLIPAGHSGLTGLRVTLAGNTILPWSTAAAWLVGTNLDKVFEVGYEVGSTINVVTYNLDLFDHQHYLLFKVTDPALDIPGPVQLLTITP